METPTPDNPNPSTPTPGTPGNPVHSVPPSGSGGGTPGGGGVSGGGVSGGGGDAASKVKPPAIGLIVAMAISILLAVLGLLMTVLGVSVGTMGAAADGDGAGMGFVMLDGTLGIIGSLIGIAVGAFVIYAATRMMRLENWTLALVAAIVAMVPIISPCCVLGLPFGIWAIVVLVQEDVKAAFRS